MTPDARPPTQPHEQAAPLPHNIALPVEEREPRADLDLRTQMVRFILTGVLSAIVDFGTYLVFMHLFGLGHNPAKALSFVLGTTTAYLINRRWTFRAEPSTARFVAVVLLYALTFALQVGINGVLFTTFPSREPGLTGLFYTTLAFVIAQGTATVVNFIVQRTVIFRLRADDAVASNPGRSGDDAR